MSNQAQHAQWYVANTGNHQGLVIEENTGRNIAVAYDKNDAPLIAAAPDLLAALEEAERDATWNDEDTVESLRVRLDNLSEAARAAIQRVTARHYE